MSADSRRDPEGLLTRARQGDADSLGALLELYRNYLHLLARTQIDLHLQGRVSPSDVVQETFLQACRHFGQFRGGSDKELLLWDAEKLELVKKLDTPAGWLAFGNQR